MTRELEGKVAIVTGAGSGLGRGSALALARAGCAVLLNDIDGEAAAETLAELEAIGAQASVEIADVAKHADVARLVACAEDRYGRLDIMHANAGVEHYEVLETTSEQDMDRLLDVDLRGALLCAQASIPALRRAGGGSIIFTSSVQATHSSPGCVVYAAAKAGLIAAARTLALEVGRDGIRVNAISPGTIETPMLMRDFEMSGLSDESEFFGEINQANALGRVGAPADIGDAVVFLASSRAAYVTAANLVVDGGYTAVKPV